MPTYRPNVACILQNPAGEILICERHDFPGSWQFPQGGLKKKESPLEGLHREMEEELGLLPPDYEVLFSKGPYRYLFTNVKKRAGYDGQEQHYFLARLTKPEARIRFEGNPPEFRAARWIAPSSFSLAWLPEMKHAVYRQVFTDFFGANPLEGQP